MSKTRAWVVRFGTLLVFNLLVLLIIVLFMRSVHGRPLGLLWAALVLTVATLWIKPALMRFARNRADGASANRDRAGQRFFAYLAVFAVAFVIWIGMILVTDVRVTGWFWGYLVPPLALLVAWFVYDLVDERLEEQSGRVYDAATRAIRKG